MKSNDLTGKKSPYVFSLKVTEKEKYANDSEWFKNYMKYVIPMDHIMVDDYELMKLSYEVANNNLDGFKDKLQNFCSPLGEDIGEIEEEIIPYPELKNKINVLKGELIKRSDQHKIMLLTAKAIKEKNNMLFKAIRDSVDEKLAIELEKQKMQMQNMKPEEVEEYVQSLRTQLEPEDLLQKNWQSEVEQFYSKALEYCKNEQQVQLKKMDSFEDVIIADRTFIYVGWKHGRPYIEVRNPLFCGFHKNPNERFVHKGDWFWYKKAVTPADVLSNYQLNEEELKLLGLLAYQNSGLDNRHDIFSPLSKPVFDHTNQELLYESENRKHIEYRKDIGLNMSSGDIIGRKRQLIWETHFEFKAYKELIFLSYTDEYNELITLTVPADFEIPKYATKEIFVNNFGEKSSRYVWFDEIAQTEFTAEKIWIPRKYEVIRLGTSVYPVIREVPFQFTSIENPYDSFELSTKGALFTARNTKSVSLLQMALAPYFQYIFIKHIQNRELSKYQGAVQDIDVDQIPDSLGEDAYGNPIRDKVAVYLTYLKRTNKSFYSGSQNSLGGLPPSTRSPGSSGFTLGTAVELMNLQQLLEYVKREIGMAMGISPQREASFDSGSNVSDNRQAITQSYHITEPYFFIHSEIWKSVLNEWLINFRTYCENIFDNNPKIKDHSIHYFLPDGTEQVLKVTPDILRHTDIGLYLYDSSRSEMYTNYMIQLVHAFAQNSVEGPGIVSGILKDITYGASPEEIHKRIQQAEAKQQERSMQMEQMKQQAAQEQIKMQIDAREDEQAHEIELAVTKEVERRETEIRKQLISALGFSQDVNENEVPDVIDFSKMQLEREKFEHQKEVDAEEIKIKRQAAKKTPKK